MPDIEALNEAGRVILLAEAAADVPSHLAAEDFGSDVLALLDQGRWFPPPTISTRSAPENAVQRVPRAFSAHRLSAHADHADQPRRVSGKSKMELDGEMMDTRLNVDHTLVRGINVIGFPALSMPCGLSSEGLPIGLQLAARPFEEHLLLMLGEALE